jgi:hypothetical protein
LSFYLARERGKMDERIRRLAAETWPAAAGFADDAFGWANGWTDQDCRE